MSPIVNNACGVQGMDDSEFGMASIGAEGFKLGL